MSGKDKFLFYTTNKSEVEDSVISILEHTEAEGKKGGKRKKTRWQCLKLPFCRNIQENDFSKPAAKTS